MDAEAKGEVDGGRLTSAEVHESILRNVPVWESYEETKANASILALLEAGVPAWQQKTVLLGNIAVVEVCIKALTIQDDRPHKWVLTVFYDMLREDTSAHAVFEKALMQKIEIYKPLRAVLFFRDELDKYTADKVAWLLTSIMTNSPNFFGSEQVVELLEALQSEDSACTPLGVLEAITNLLKVGTWRALVMKQPGVAHRVFSTQPRGTSAAYMYRCAFALWMLSYEREWPGTISGLAVVQKIRDILVCNRVEKVIRVCLAILRNFLCDKDRIVDIVEESLLEAVQRLEYEKWRDSELYDDIRDMSQLISLQVNELTNFDRYERELHTGSLKWGFIHTSKFWSENVLRFEHNDFQAVKLIAALLRSDDTDPTTRAVACHDLGEFVAMHPLGKKVVNKLRIKDRVMHFMSTNDPSHKEIRREALLCCQKIILNHWQDLDPLK